MGDSGSEAYNYHWQLAKDQALSHLSSNPDLNFLLQPGWSASFL